MAHCPAIAVDPQYLRMRLRQPSRWRRCRRAHDRAYPVTTQHGDGPIEQIKVERSLARLEDMPGEFAETRNVEPGLRHALCVALPIAFVDMLGIMRDADEKAVSVDGAPNGEIFCTV